MLAKMWKKILFAICIIACIYNVMSKLVNRHSLEENLKNANDGEVVFEITDKSSKSSTEIKITNDTYLNEVTESSVATNETILETNNIEETKKTEESNTKTDTNKFMNFDFLF